jgi:hypothetical protein
MCGGPIAWLSRLQRSISQSTTEAEFVSLNEANSAVWLKRILTELNSSHTEPIEIRCDNQGAIRFVQNPENHQRTKHIEVKFLYVREQQQKWPINVVFVGTKYQLANGLTKGLSRPRLQELWKQLGVTKLVRKILVIWYSYITNIGLRGSIGNGLSNLTSTLIYLQMELVGEPSSCQSE